MNRYLEHMHTRSPHERRQHALRVAGVLTALIFAGWVTTFGLQSAGGVGSQVAGSGQGVQSAAAVVANSPYAQNQLIVATSSDY